MSDFHTVGKAYPRQDSPAKVTGEARYAADIQRPNMLHAKILRSPYAHARIIAIDTSAAKALPGVHAVVTAADLPLAEIDTSLRAHIVFAKDEVIWHAQPVAAVAAESVDIAEEALDLIRVDYEELPAVLSAEAGMKEDAPLARLSMDEAADEDREGHMTITVTGDDTPKPARRTNMMNRLRFRRGDVEQGFAEADIVVEGRFEAAMVHQSPIEPQVAVAEVDGAGKLTVWSPTQGQFHQREEIATVLGVPVTGVRLISAEIGGGFGARVAPLVHPIVGLLALKTGRPVKIVLTRREELAAGVPAQHTITTIKLGAKNDGRLTTIQAKIIFDSGSFASGLGLASVMVAATYRYDHLDIDSVKVLTNKVSTGAYRAPGGPEVTFAIEQLVDEVARKLNMDPIALRRMNAVEEGDIMPNGKAWPRIGLKEGLDALEASDLWQTRHRPAEDGKRRSVGVAVAGWLGGFQPASAIVRLNEGGQVSVILGSNDISGTNTTFAQIAAEVLNAPLSMVRAYTADTDTAPFAGMVTGSKATYSFGPAVKAAAEDARKKILAIAASELAADPDTLAMADGAVTNPATGASLTFKRISHLSMSNGSRYAPVLGQGAEVVREVAPSFTAQAVETEVDEQTGEITITRVAAVQDCGRAINPLSVIGQLEGGVVQSLGMGKTEEMVFDHRGAMANATFLDYRLLTAMDVPAIESILVEVPSEYGPYGARIVGEPSIMPGSAALANAVRGATGVRYYEAPMTPERVLRGLRQAQPAVAAVG